ncbi:MAG: site-specific integrase [Acidobacteria bacterium]|nr:site-specific integrase [Acidobacteriota bacterium]
MSVTKRGKKWHFKIQVNGVRYWGVLEKRTKREAEEEEAEIVHRIRTGEYIAPRKDSTLKEFIEQVYKPHAKESKKSFRSDESMLKPIIEKLGKKRLSKISSFDIEKYKSERRKSTTVRFIKSGDEKIHKPRSVSSVNKELKLLSRIFKLAKIRPNPCDEVELIKGEAKRRRWMKHTEFQKLLPFLMEDRRAHLLDIVILDLNTGIRQKEQFCLKPEDCDFEHEVIIIRDSKTGEGREVAMNTEAREILKRLVKQAEEKGWEYLFTNPATGTRWKSILRSWTTACRKAGIMDLHFRDLRRTWATHALASGAPVTGVRDNLGHGSISTTNIYAQATDEGKKKAVSVVEWNKSGTKQKRQAG